MTLAYRRNERSGVLLADWLSRLFKEPEQKHSGYVKTAIEEPDSYPPDDEGTLAGIRRRITSYY